MILQWTTGKPTIAQLRIAVRDIGASDCLQYRVHVSPDDEIEVRELPGFMPSVMAYHLGAFGADIGHLERCRIVGDLALSSGEWTIHAEDQDDWWLPVVWRPVVSHANVSGIIYTPQSDITAYELAILLGMSHVRTATAYTLRERAPIDRHFTIRW